MASALGWALCNQTVTFAHPFVTCAAKSLFKLRAAQAPDLHA
jgi:hypothetical protein